MSEPIIFKDLPATFPEKDRYKRPSLISSVIFHVVLIVVLILIPLLLPETISQRGLLITLVAPPPPPPAAPPPPPAPVAAAVTPKAIKPRIQPVAPNALVMPTVIPKDVAKIIEQPVVSPIIGVVGGVPGGVAGGILGNILSANSNAARLGGTATATAPSAPSPTKGGRTCGTGSRWGRCERTARRQTGPACLSAIGITGTSHWNGDPGSHTNRRRNCGSDSSDLGTPSSHRCSDQLR